MSARPVVFLDRDGIINSYPGDSDYVKSWEEFHFLPGVKPALKRLNEKGFSIFIISNQAGVSKGIYSRENLDLITKNMLQELNAHKIDIAAVYYCIHRQEDNCSCRKPKTGLVDTAVAKLKSEGAEPELGRSYFIGDTIRDIETGKAAGLKTILVFSGKEKADNKDKWATFPDYTAKDLSAAVDLILNLL
ncbi:MAG: HAD family hydrolase [Candidatus Omnitrophota bacterium]